MAESATTDVYHPNAKWEWLEPLCLSGSVNLAFETSQGVSWPVLLDDIARDQALVINITAVPALAKRLIDGEAFRLIGHVNGAMVCTSPLVVLEPLEALEGFTLRCQYPEFLSTTHRRGTFRAPIRPDMGIVATLSVGSPGTMMQAEIRNLSLGDAYWR
ncbi:hypothetical protein [Salinicola acroporae]|uniref:hypothetical protein n=1 Tax=Salinicola acroporae TaxID=1541440 RepID=UPI002457AAB6|nr:hypothetical protein [Salinicola acroporae]